MAVSGGAVRAAWGRLWLAVAACGSLLAAWGVRSRAPYKNRMLETLEGTAWNARKKGGGCRIRGIVRDDSFDVSHARASESSADKYVFNPHSQGTNKIER